MTSATTTCRGALLVLLEPSAHEPEAVTHARAHASLCPRCAGAFDDADAPRRVLDRLAGQRVGGSAALRGLLVVLAVVQLVVACPWLFGASLVPDANVAVAHLTRDGAFGLVVAGVALLAVWRPRYVLAATLMGAAVFVAQFATGLVDDQSRYVNAMFELTHLLVVAILVVLAFILATARRQPVDTPRRPPTLRSL